MQKWDDRAPDARPTSDSTLYTQLNRGIYMHGLTASVPPHHCRSLRLGWDSSVGGRILIPWLHTPLLHITVHSQHLLIEQQAAPASTCRGLSAGRPACRAFLTMHACMQREERSPHVGQVAFRRSQPVTQALWKMWPQGRETTFTCMCSRCQQSAHASSAPTPYMQLHMHAAPLCLPSPPGRCCTPAPQPVIEG